MWRNIPMTASPTTYRLLSAAWYYNGNDLIKLPHKLLKKTETLRACLARERLDSHSFWIWPIRAAASILYSLNMKNLLTDQKRKKKKKKKKKNWNYSYKSSRILIRYVLKIK
jgi:hypothetical protein